MFKFKDIIKMDYETYKRLITTVNSSQSAFTLQVNKAQSTLELLVDEQITEEYAFSVEPWMEPDEKSE